MSTIIDVARHAGVSKSTVSRVLTGGPVSQEARERVLAAMKALNYQPNAVARGLVSNRSMLLGVLISDVADPYYAELMRGMEERALKHRYDLLIHSTLWEQERELAYLRRLVSRRVDGVIIVGGREITDPALIDTYLHMAGQGRPLLFIDRGVDDVKVPRVEVDNVAAAREATRHLLDLGHRRIAHIAGPADVCASQARVAGYRAALADAGIPFDSNLLVAGDFKKGSGFDLALRLLDLTDPPTAIFAANDLMALGAWRAILSRGLTVPGDIALVGFDDIELLDIAEVPLTTVRQPRYEMGCRAIDLLIAMLVEESDPHSERVVTLPTELVIRGSCGFTDVRDDDGMADLSIARIPAR